MIFTTWLATLSSKQVFARSRSLSTWFNAHSTYAVGDIVPASTASTLLSDASL
jgi:hypothetical protein